MSIDDEGAGVALAVEVAERAMAPATGVYALATMTDEEFDRRLTAMKKGRERVQRIQRAMMVEGVHYGKVPGRENDKDAQFGLRKPGAEVLYSLYNYVPDCPDATVRIEYGDLSNEASPALRITVRCEMHAGDLGGPVIGVGYGAASSWEIKYRYRNAGRICPKCQRETILRSKFPAKGGPWKGLRGWYCFAKAGGCGEEFGPEDAVITGQVVGRTANPDALDLLNTLLKMAEKRAVVDATIRATATSDLFTQDLEDMGGSAEEEAERAARPAGVTTDGEVADSAPAPTAETPLGFGRMADKKLADLPTKYLDWMLEDERDFGTHTAAWQRLAREELARREQAEAKDADRPEATPAVLLTAHQDHVVARYGRA